MPLTTGISIFSADRSGAICADRHAGPPNDPLLLETRCYFSQTPRGRMRKTCRGSTPRPVKGGAMLGHWGGAKVYHLGC